MRKWKDQKTENAPIKNGGSRRRQFAAKASVRLLLRTTATPAVLATLAAGLTCLFRSEFVSGALSVCSPAAFGGNFPLLLRIHGCEAAITAWTIVSHFCLQQ
jgi:hypothetical protein